ncbi:L,D-transpeptidase family protein [Erythrobacter sp.]|jgi:lipoprotein-anchoring transpeptidase ErfK/SrfK|uniref:L,D-transpeptidase family protein n=1 Tax=Erythrobacter sp. TaxID=1042 RepID=UPI002ECC6998|nr:L,D-transpeptidase [Erythrobacter sp.]
MAKAKHIFTGLFAPALFAACPAAAQSQSGSDTAAQGNSAQSPDQSDEGVEGFDLSPPDRVPDSIFDDARSEEVLTVQVLLDRSRHSPGVIDGIMGGNTRRAIRYYREANGLRSSEEIDAELMRSLISSQSGDVFRSYTITQEDVAGPFYAKASGMEEMAEMERVGWYSPLEMFADRFHMDQDFLAALNPDADFSAAGTDIIIVSHGDEELSSSIARIEIRKAENSVVALGDDGKVLASYPATIGSDQFPSPAGSMEVDAIAPEANYTFNPQAQEWGPDETLVIPPGPNNPVGGIWIDLSKEGYGIHGSPDPQLIGKTASHGCVRLTNWDAHELANALDAGTPVIFQ